MQVSTFHLLTQSLITTKNVYCSHIDNPPKLYQYTIKDCSVARKSHNLIEVDIYITLFPTAKSKKIVHIPLQQRIYNFSQGKELPICLSKFSINDTSSTIEIVNNTSSLKGGSLELPVGEELGLHIKYQYADTFFSSTIQNKGTQKYEFEFELIWNSEYKDTNREKAFFTLFSSEYKEHKGVLLLENKIYRKEGIESLGIGNESTKNLGIILKLKAQKNQHVQSGGQKFTFVPLKEANTSDKLDYSTQKTFTKTGPSLQQIPSKKADSDSKFLEIKPKKSRRRAKSLSYDASSAQTDSSNSSTLPITPQRKDDINNDSTIKVKSVTTLQKIKPKESRRRAKFLYCVASNKQRKSLITSTPPVTPTIQDDIHQIPTIEDSIHQIPTIEECIYQVTPIEECIHQIPTIEDSIYQVPTIEECIHQIPTIEDSIHQIPTIEECIHQISTIEDSIYQVTPIEECIHQVPTIEECIHQVTPIEECIHQVTPIEDSIYQVTPLNDAVHHETPIEESVYQETSRQESIHQEIPSQETLPNDIHHETPLNDDVHYETPLNVDIHHETSSQESIHQETPINNDIHQAIPINDDIHEDPQRKDDIHEDPTKNSPTESSSHEEESSEYEYKPINFFSTVGGVTMLIQCLITIVLFLLPMIYKFISIHLNRRIGLFLRNSKK